MEIFYYCASPKYRSSRTCWKTAIDSTCLVWGNISIIPACVSLDSFFSDVKKIDFIKIDAQGAEPYILKGAVGILDKFRPILLMEWEEFPDDWAVESYDLLQKLEYKTFDVNQFNKPCLSVNDYLPSQIPDKRTNLLCLPSNVALYNPFNG